MNHLSTSRGRGAALMLTAFLTLGAVSRLSVAREASSNSAVTPSAPSSVSVPAAVATNSAASDPKSVPVTVTLFDGAPGAEIPSTFCGLSYELSTLLPGPDGIRYFRPDNAPLLAIFRTLGIRNLRVGGNLGDRDFKSAPSEADIDSLFAFAKRAGVKVIYCLRLHHGDAAEQARVAKYIWDHYEPLLDCFTIGQEPSAYPVEAVDTRRADQRMGEAHEHYRYEDFAAEWLRFDDEIRKNIPNVRIAGPSVYKKTDWPLRFLEDFAKDGRLSLVTAHLYPGGPGNAMVATPDIGRDRMLSGEFEPGYRGTSETVIPAAASRNLGLRIEECNNYFNGGCRGVSDSYAASLWGLDFLWWWASHGAVGINFHTGEKVAEGSKLGVCAYSSFFIVPQGVQVQPLSYGIKAFDLSGKGRIVPLSLSAPDPNLRISAYAALDSNSLTVTLINREIGPVARPFDVRLALGSTAGPAECMALTSPAGDSGAKQGILLGGSDITGAGTWDGAWKPLPATPEGKLEITVPPASAMLVRFPVTGKGWTPPAFLKLPTRGANDAVTPVGNARHERFLNEIAASKGDIGLVLVGDSITDFWPKTGTDSYIGFLPWKPLNLGISGERTEAVLWRLQNGELDGYKARAVMVMIGTNNLRFAEEKPEWVAAGIRKIVETIRRKQPGARILLLGVFPRGASPQDPIRARVARVNELIKPLADGKNVVYMDLTKDFLDDKGNLSPRIMPDFIHPTAVGYRIWFESVKPVLEGWMRK